MKASRIVLSAAFLAAMIAAPGCKKDADKSKPGAAGATATDEPGADPSALESGKKVAVDLQLNWTPEPEFGGFYAGVHKGIYGEEGLEVSLKAGGAGVQTWKMVATGKVPFAIASGDEIIRARLKDADLVALFAVYQTNPHALMVHASSGVTSLEEIFTSGKVKKVAMESGLPYVHFVKKKYGFDKLEVIQHGGNLSLFLQDPTMAQQCFVFSEPVSAKEQGVEVKAFSVADGGYNPYTAVVITSESYMKQNRDVVARFVKATRAAWREYLDDPEPTNQYMKEQKSPMSISAMKLSAELQKSYIETEETRANALGHMTEERWTELAAQLQEIGEIKESPDVSELFVNIATK